MLWWSDLRFDSGDNTRVSRLDYVFDLRELAATCKFGVLHDEMIRDQLIEKTAFVKARDRLLEEMEDLTLEKAFSWRRGLSMWLVTQRPSEQRQVV